CDSGGKRRERAVFYGGRDDGSGRYNKEYPGGQRGYGDAGIRAGVRRNRRGSSRSDAGGRRKHGNRGGFRRHEGRGRRKSAGRYSGWGSAAKGRKHRSSKETAGKSSGRESGRSAGFGAAAPPGEKRRVHFPADEPAGHRKTAA